MEPYVIWLAVGLGTLILELLSGTMFLLWVACGCFMAGLVGWLAPGVMWAPWAMFVVSTSILLYVGRNLAQRLHKAGGMVSNVDSLVGQKAVVLEAVDPVENTGRVRIGSDEWRARSDARHEEKEQVLVTAIEGATLIVCAVAGES